MKKIIFIFNLFIIYTLFLFYFLMSTSCAKCDAISIDGNLSFFLVDSLDVNLIDRFPNDLQIFDSLGTVITDFTIEEGSGKIEIPFLDWPLMLEDSKSSIYFVKLRDLSQDTIRIKYSLGTSDTKCGETAYFSDCIVYFNNELIYNFAQENNNRILVTIPDLIFQK